MKDLWVFEKEAIGKGCKNIAGIDEAGRGPLAGPVVSAAVILPASFSLVGVDDSKRLTPKKRETLFGKIYENATSVGVGVVGPQRIDEINILKASLKSMAMAVACLNPQPDCLLIDGIFKIDSDLPQIPITKGDSRSVSIAAASIIAKVTRDNMMAQYHKQYPEYGFARHKGYGTVSHRHALRQLGPTPEHRLTFSPLKATLL